LYLSQLMQSLSNYNTKSIIIPDGESYKTLDTMDSILTSMLEHRFNRDSCLIALGGGVVGDITGFAAACYQRGIKYIQVPTTLLAQVDSSVGGKTAVNHELGKNMIGAFHQPIGVVADTNLLSTLPDRELSSGLAEIIKHGVIRDSDFFSWLELNMDKLVSRDPESLVKAIERSCIIKAEIVAEDEMESGIRALLNLGHTFGHAIETGLNYKEWLHGEAVSVGMSMAADLSCRLGWLDKEKSSRINSLLNKAGLPIELPASLKAANLRELMSVDKKVKAGKLFLILLKDIGHAVVTDKFDESDLQETLTNFPSMTELV